MPPAARVIDLTACPMVAPGPVPHVGGPIIPPCQHNVIVCGMPQARVSDTSICAAGGPAKIVTGAFNVLIGGKPAARIGDTTSHGGKIITGCPTVLIGTKIPSVHSLPHSCQRDEAKAGASFIKVGGPASSQPPAEVAPQLSEFAKGFANKTGGLSLADSLKLYEADTGKKLDESTVEKLLTDSEFAEKTLSADEQLHRNYRDILNSNIPQTEADAKKQGFERLPWHQSMFHNPQYGLNPFIKNNSKYISPDGHREAVFDPNGGLLSDNNFKGTFNFFGPDQSSEHWSADVIPYNKWGN